MDPPWSLAESPHAGKATKAAAITIHDPILLMLVSS
jgi:hypothetical protein